MPIQEERCKCTIYPSKETVKRWDAAVVLSGCKSRSDFASRAIEFYAGYLSAQEHTGFFADIIPKVMSGMVHSSENRLARLQFKFAVEQAKLAHILASVANVDDEELRQLHIRCVNEVKRINGVVTLDNAVHDRQGE